LCKVILVIKSKRFATKLYLTKEENGSVGVGGGSLIILKTIFYVFDLINYSF